MTITLSKSGVLKFCKRLIFVKAGVRIICSRRYIRPENLTQGWGSLLPLQIYSVTLNEGEGSCGNERGRSKQASCKEQPPVAASA